MNIALPEDSKVMDPHPQFEPQVIKTPMEGLINPVYKPFQDDSIDKLYPEFSPANCKVPLSPNNEHQLMFTKVMLEQKAKVTVESEKDEDETPIKEETNLQKETSPGVSKRVSYQRNAKLNHSVLQQRNLKSINEEESPRKKKRKYRKKGK